MLKSFSKMSAKKYNSRTTTETRTHRPAVTGTHLQAVKAATEASVLERHILMISLFTLEPYGRQARTTEPKIVQQLSQYVEKQHC